MKSRHRTEAEHCLFCNKYSCLWVNSSLERGYFQQHVLFYVIIIYQHLKYIYATLINCELIQIIVINQSDKNQRLDPVVTGQSNSLKFQCTHLFLGQRGPRIPRRLLIL
jgi:hypothetical protein